MYQTFFGLAAAPFSIAPDPRYLYMSRRHQEALATLLYGLNSDGGFVLLTGEVGAGKTTICRCLLEQLPEACDVAYLFNPKLTVIELLSSICDEFGIDYPSGTASIKCFVDLLNHYLLEAHARGRRAVLIIDEAQNLSPEVLEQIRLLTNLETNQRKLLQILLLGQPELIGMLARPELRQLAQRIVARYHLQPLTRAEVAAYVKHRLEVAGAQWPPFPERLLGQIYRLSGGVPRVINLLCDRALLGAFVQRRERVDRATLEQAAREVLPPRARPEWLAVRRSYLGGALALLAALGTGVAFYPWPAPDAERALAQQPAPAEQQPPAVPAAPVPPAPPVPLATTASSHPGVPGFLALPPDVPPARSEAVAFATLFRSWHAAYREGEDPCRQAAAQGLQCRTTRGGLEELRKLNVPVILHLTDDKGRRFYAALTALDANSATFSFGAQRRQVPVGAFALQWTGDYTVLLRLPQDLSERAVKGGNGGALGWLGMQLSRFDGGARAADGQSHPLETRVRQFQLAHGLTPDGVVGFKTLALLSVAYDPAAPRLSAAERGE